MSSPTAKELLAQADRLMRQRTPEELPVLTDLVIEEIELKSLSDRVDPVAAAGARPSPMPASPAVPGVAVAAKQVPPVALAATPMASVPPARAPVEQFGETVEPAVAAARRTPPLAELFAGRALQAQDTPGGLASAGGPSTQSALASVREKFNEQLLAKMEELQHSVFSQVMQKLEIHSAGSMKTHLRETLEPALIGIARELAEQVAEDTATQVRQVVSDAVDAEIARLREQFAKKRF